MTSIIVPLEQLLESTTEPVAERTPQPVAEPTTEPETGSVSGDRGTIIITAAVPTIIMTPAEIHRISKQFSRSARLFHSGSLAGAEPGRVVHDAVHDRVSVDPSAETVVPVLLGVPGTEDQLR
ncbi:hypothetical protein FAM15061_001695 [Propionibacterium freudenreichii]|uniref:hypothetical protein n=1 Tax=Propionibacterium freudenreichii TaxID=1744 RepID=UPI002549CC38|nr:hypothetical protein [Propionibacterium freudenreichii]MDK9611952.1 hypothetical protein [Propionibacterium freudenreichii]MDK9623674.1 hypothetical protein [Propionibacterium freudenreichii]